jgi:hypothetical protein
MPFSVTAGTAWSFFSLFSMCGTRLIYSKRHFLVCQSSNYWK